MRKIEFQHDGSRIEADINEETRTVEKITTFPEYKFREHELEEIKDRALYEFALLLEEEEAAEDEEIDIDYEDEEDEDEDLREGEYKDPPVI